MLCAREWRDLSWTPFIGYLLASSVSLGSDVMAIYARDKFRFLQEVISLLLTLVADFFLAQATGGSSSPFLFVFLLTPLWYGLRSGTRFGYLSASLSSLALFAIAPRSPALLALMGAVWVVAGAVNSVVKSAAIQQRELTHLAQRDPLTGLMNRRSMLESIDRLITKGSPFCLMLLDLDKFKTINDSIGHLGGDEVLKKVSSAIARVTRSADVVARYGGDEFAVVMEGTADNALRVITRLKQAVRRLGVDIGFELGISSGLASWPEDGRTPTRLLQVADARLYEAKERARSERPNDGPQDE